MCIYVATKGTSFFTLLRMAGPSAVRRVAWISPSTSKGRLVRGLIFRVGGFFVSVQLWHILGSWNLWKQIESPSVHCYFAPWFQHVSADTKVSGNCGCSSRWRQLCPVKICILVWNWRHGPGKGGKGGKGRYSMHPWWASLKNSTTTQFQVFQPNLSSVSWKIQFSDPLRGSFK